VDIARINPNTRTAPVFRARSDVELTDKIYSRVPVFVNDQKGAAGDPWSFRYMTKMFDMADSSSLFRTAHQLVQESFKRVGTDWISREDSAERYVPLYEAKMISFFDHRAASYGERGNERGYRALPETTRSQHTDPTYEVEPFYWISSNNLEAKMDGRPWKRPWLMGWKDVAAVTNERTVLTAAFPRVAVGHTIRVMFVNDRRASPATVIANLNTMTLDYIARLKFGGLHLTVETLKQLPILPPLAYNETELKFVLLRVLELSYTSNSMGPFARDLGHEGSPFAWNEDRRALLRAELDAFYARAYGLTRDELRYILDPEDAMGAGYPSETFRVLKTNEIRRFGEYRTARLVLAAWDAAEQDRAGRYATW
jgi:hypothetical protein